jgi:acetolactate synthase I/II/III large subunit
MSSKQTQSMTAAQHVLALSTQLGIEYIFTNLGSDHPAFIEAFALFNEQSRAMPKIVPCPHESTAMSIAHGYAMITRKPQIVLVHVDVGTANLGGTVHNAFRGRVPVIVIAGMSPTTMPSATNAQRVGGRNEFIHFLQDASRQSALVDQYMKWCYELRAGEMIEPVMMRAMQIATSEPQGPVYITGAREVWEETSDQKENIAHWPTVCHSGLPDADINLLVDALKTAKRPLLITSALGRNPESVPQLVTLAERVGMAVCEVSPQYLSFPGTHLNHVGYRRNSLVDEADVILLFDVDVPWIPSKVQPANNARIFIVDQDVLKPSLGFWHFPSERCWNADSHQVLQQLLAKTSISSSSQRQQWIAQAKARFNPSVTLTVFDGPIKLEELLITVRELVTDKTVVITEAPTATETIPSILQLDRPGSCYSSGGSSLGFAINAAIGVKLAQPDAEVISIVGDGSYVFGVPSSAYWVARAFDVAHLTIIINNGGWAAPRMSTLGVHPEGIAKRNDTFWVTMTKGARLAQIATAAGDAAAFEVHQRSELKSSLQQALHTVRGGRCAVVEVMLTPISSQLLS